MNNLPLISIVTPCHNSARFFYRLFDSILSQNYPNVEMIVVDNDSTDETPNVVAGYISLFQEKGYNLSYYHQKDSGPSAAINNGLKHVKGDYLLMPDSDDFYSDSNLFRIMVDKFQSLPDDYAVVRCQEQCLYEDDLSKGPINGENASEEDPGTLFLDCLLVRNSYFYPTIGYMVKVKCFRELTDMKIFHTYYSGQHRQIFLPLYYKYKCYTITKPLTNYLIRRDSVSHGDYGKYDVYMKLYACMNEYIDSIFNCINSMPSDEKVGLKMQFMKNETENMIIRALNNHEKADYSFYRDELKKYGGISLPFRLKIFKIKLKLMIKYLLKK